MPEPEVSIYLEELRGSSSGFDDGWEAEVRVTIGATRRGLDRRGITVTGGWQGAFDAEVSGETNRQGRVTFQTPLLKTGIGVVFRVISVSHPDFFYDPSLNETDSVVVIPRAGILSSPG